MSLLNKIHHYSISSLQLWADCPRSWWEKYVLGNEQPSSEAASFGSQFDQVISTRLGFPAINKKTGKPEKMGPLLEGVEEAVEGYFAQPFAIKKATGCQEKIDISPDQWAVLGEICALSLQIDKPITGYIDVSVANESLLVDLKTSKRAGMQPKWAFQVLVYAIAKQFNQARIHLMTRTKTPAYYDYMVFLTPETKKWAMMNFTYYANQIEAALRKGDSEELARNPDFYCSWCPAAVDCPARMSC